MTVATARRPMVGTGWKMNHTVEATRAYARELGGALPALPRDGLDIFVLPPFTALHAARDAFADLPVGIGAQNMHEAESGPWTGEVSAPMLVEAGCRYVALAHSERLRHFGESYAAVRRKTDTAMRHGLTPILCLGELAADKDAGRADHVLAEQVRTVLEGREGADVARVVLAYEPRWAIGGDEAASPEYVAERHGRIRDLLRADWGRSTAEATRVVYGGSVNAENGPALIALDEVDGLFVGRSAWTGEGLARMARIVSAAYPG